MFVQTEDGLGEIDCDKFPLALSYQDTLTALEALYTEQHPYRTLVVDSLDWLERLIWAEVCRQRSVENIEDIGYGKGYAFALTSWREFLTGLDALRNDRGMTVVLIAHSRIERFENPETDSYDRYVPRLHKLASQIIQEWCDEVLFATYKVYTKQTDEGFSRKKTKGIGTGKRVLYTSERPSHVAKNVSICPTSCRSIGTLTLLSSTNPTHRTKDLPIADLHGFNANEVDPTTDLEPIPAGKYLAMITDSEMKPTKSGDGRYLQLTFQVLEGPYRNRFVWARLNLHNANETAVKIARVELSAICRAVGVLTPRDSCELHNLPLIITVKLKKREDTGELQNEVRGYAKKEAASGQPQQAAASAPPGGVDFPRLACDFW